MDQQFMFVDGRKTDRASKKLVRRHVMKGKNAGKKVLRPTRLALQDARKQINSATMDEREPLWACNDLKKRHQRSDWIYLSEKMAALAFGNVLLPFALPVPVTPLAMDIMNTFFTNIGQRIYPPRLGLDLQDFKLAWCRLLFSDVDAYNCSILLMSSSNEFFLGNGHSSPKALYNQSHMFHAVNERLQGENAISNSTIAIVLSLIHHEQIKNEQSSAAVHNRGLEMLIRLRGGLHKLEADGNILLIMKVCKTDILFSLQHGGETMFFRDSMSAVRNALATKGLILDGMAAAESAPRSSELDPYLREALQDMMAVCLLFNNGLRNRTLDYLLFLEIIVSLFYRLIWFHPLKNTNKETSVDNVYHVGMLAFMSTMLVQRGPRRIIKCQMISKTVEEAVQRRLPSVDDELAFWLMYMGAIWSDKGPDGEWIGVKIRNTATRLGVESWGKARDCLRRFPWIDALHDEPGLEVWNRVNGQDRAVEI
ncbi:hypothetical protein QQS21_000693 [Conoideocrella luteorostrata]|uniref:Tachykinin family protein n=1 Tax=Conoideocrella luteorostrata TaxID=1105319 RepID=A0AAJ0D0S9_9HYPO|nr:hypothetical protein QQS21_000693 [Conoideocrella luteorostrata]